jgi:hypothetical protein
VGLAGREQITGTARLKAAARARAAQPQQKRRDDPLVTANQRADQPHEENSAPRLARICHSSRKAWKLARAAAWRAMSTNHAPSHISPKDARTISRKRRLTRFRSTAPPTLREVMNPIRVAEFGAHFRTLKTKSLPWKDTPSRFNFENSPARVRRVDLGKRRRVERMEIQDFPARGARRSPIAAPPLPDRLGLRVAGIVDFHALGKQPFSSALPAAGKDGTAILGLHPGAEPELTFARALGRLVGAFHNP